MKPVKRLLKFGVVFISGVLVVGMLIIILVSVLGVI